MSSSFAGLSALSAKLTAMVQTRWKSVQRRTLFGLFVVAAIVGGFVPVLLSVKIGMNGFWSALIIYGVAVTIACATAIWVVLGGKSPEKETGPEVNQIAEHIGDAILRYDCAGQMVFVSSSAKTLFGCQKFELSGSGLADRTHVLDRPLFLTAFSDARMAGDKRQVEVRMRRDNTDPGQIAPDFIWVEVSLSPITSNGRSGNSFELIVMIRDISRRKTNEKRLVEAQAVAESASRAKSQFLATVGHELRTPLNAIVGFSELLASDIGGELEPAQAEYAGLIGQSGRHLLEVINSMLDMSRIEAGKFELDTASFEPERLVAPCLQMISKAAREKNIDIEVKLGKIMPEIVADERACRQIIINLLSNAVKFSEPGGSVIWSMKSQGRFLNLTIKDSGIGMSDEYLLRLGEPFSQAHTGTGRRYEGSGLGISIVKGLIELHQGSFNVTSQSGSGTTISVLLPVKGPATNQKEDDGITPLHAKSDQKPGEIWPEQKRIAR